MRLQQLVQPCIRANTIDPSNSWYTALPGIDRIGLRGTRGHYDLSLLGTRQPLLTLRLGADGISGVQLLSRLVYLALAGIDRIGLRGTRGHGGHRRYDPSSHAPGSYFLHYGLDSYEVPWAEGVFLAGAASATPCLRGHLLVQACVTRASSPEPSGWFSKPAAKCVVVLACLVGSWGKFEVWCGVRPEG